MPRFFTRKKKMDSQPENKNQEIKNSEVQEKTKEEVRIESKCLLCEGEGKISRDDSCLDCKGTGKI